MSTAITTWAQGEFRVDVGNADAWQAQLKWVGRPSTDFSASKRPEGLRFEVKDRKCMKWRREIAQPIDLCERYLCLRYRCGGLRPGSGYALFLSGDGGEYRPVRLADLTADGRSHVVCADLRESGLRTIRAIAVQVDPAGEGAWLEVASLTLRDDVPGGASLVGSVASKQELFTWDVPLPEASKWIQQSGWVGAGHAARECRCVQSAAGPRFEAGHARRRMKWSCPLPEARDMKPFSWAAVRYRAENIEPRSDYAVWLGASGTGTGQCVYVLTQRDLRADGHWHVAFVPIDASFAATTAAAQVCAGQGPGWLELDFVRMYSRRPVLSSDGVLAIRRGLNGSQLPRKSVRFVDLAPHCNARGAAAAGWLDMADWPAPGEATVGGVPFTLGEGVVTTRFRGTAALTIPVDSDGCELLVLLGARLPRSEIPSFSRTPGPLSSVSEPERLVCRVRYADGTQDEAIPLHVASGKHEVLAGLEVYAIRTREARIASLCIEDRMVRGALFVAGLTVNQSAQPMACPGGPSLPHYELAPCPPASFDEVRVTREGEHVVLRSGPTELVLDLSHGVRLASLASAYQEAPVAGHVPSELLSIRVGEGEIAGSAAVVREVVVRRDSCDVKITLSRLGASFEGMLRFACRPNGQIALEADLTNRSGKPVRAALTFPRYEALRIGSAADTWYLWNRPGGVIHDSPMADNARHCGRDHPVQFDTIFAPRHGSGLYFMTQDTANRFHGYAMSKDESGVSYSIESFEEELADGQAFDLPPSVLAAHGGDWHVAFAAYRAWVRTWYRPAVPRKDWLRRVFAWRSHFITEEMFDRKTATYDVNSVLDGDVDAFGYVDYVHLRYWCLSSKYGRVGDYRHYDEVGGRERLLAAIQRIQARGLPVGLYLEGYLVDKRGLVGRERLDEWQLVGRDGKPRGWHGDSPERFVCPSCASWQDHQAKTYARLHKELGVDGFYIDQFGFTDPGKLCYNPRHNHRVPEPPLRGEQQFQAKVRAALPDSVVLYVEETPNDFNAQWCDASFSYTIPKSASDSRTPHRVHLFRFCFPDFKVFQYSQIQPARNGNWPDLKYCFFNGEGFYLQWQAARFGPEARAFLRRCLKIMHEHADAFCSMEPEPLVPTLRAGLYANRFPAGSDVVYTLFNANWQTVRGPLLAVDHPQGASYEDLWSGAAVEARVDRGRATLGFAVGPRSVGCVVQRLPAHEEKDDM